MDSRSVATRVVCFYSESFFGADCFAFSHRLADQGELMRVMLKTNQNGIGQRGVADGFMPVRYRQLASHDRGTMAVGHQGIQPVAPRGVGQ